MENPIVIAALIVGGIAFLFMMVGMVTTSWVTGTGFHVGLFVKCVDHLGCASYDATGRLAAARAFIVIGFMCGLAAAIVALIYYFKYLNKNEANRTLPLVAGLLFLISGAVTLLGIILAVSGDSAEGVSLGYSFGLSLIGSLMALVSGALILFHRTKVVSA